MEMLPQVGCICCLSYGIINNWVQIHHITEGGKRLGHDYTLPLCYFHHEGIPPEGMSVEQAEEKVGPSLKSKKKFNEVFGGELVLLDYVNEALEIIDGSII